MESHRQPIDPCRFRRPQLSDLDRRDAMDKIFSCSLLIKLDDGKYPQGANTPRPWPKTRMLTHDRFVVANQLVCYLCNLLTLHLIDFLLSCLRLLMSKLFRHAEKCFTVNYQAFS